MVVSTRHILLFPLWITIKIYPGIVVIGYDSITQQIASTVRSGRRNASTTNFINERSSANVDQPITRVRCQTIGKQLSRNRGKLRRSLLAFHHNRYLLNLLCVPSVCAASTFLSILHDHFHIFPSHFHDLGNVVSTATNNTAFDILGAFRPI